MEYYIKALLCGDGQITKANTLYLLMPFSRRLFTCYCLPYIVSIERYCMWYYKWAWPIVHWGVVSSLLLRLPVLRITGQPLAQDGQCLHMFLQEPVLDRSYVPEKMRSTNWHHLIRLPYRCMDWFQSVFLQHFVQNRNNKHPMNIGTNFNYNNQITFISTHTKIGTPHKRAPVTIQTEVNLPIRLFHA